MADLKRGMTKSSLQSAGAEKKVLQASPRGSWARNQLRNTDADERSYYGYSTSYSPGLSKRGRGHWHCGVVHADAAGRAASVARPVGNSSLPSSRVPQV